ncbi:heavy-metal-associated domain-containing protein [Actinocatenispora rupis]|uniref:HMA domain-containing protein n=1 Tax=Actinocatenispora rupis TaxID=519421 RepID=A0A8J3J1G1_9ACTN|nr:heavy metal-associated domain-containing protein [Actinocatenispora rupis]GID12458.1 hypothetical protein Aru02nite_33470 [Actinocatenispora rupis]
MNETELTIVDESASCACCAAPATTPAEAPDATVYAVGGMTCGGCAGRVTAAVTDLPGVREARADPATGQVAVYADPQPDTERIAAAVTAAGYTFAGPVGA